MKKLIILIILIAIGYGAWYFASPLFIDKVVEEDFPEIAEEAPTIPKQDVIDAMTEEEKMEMEKKIVMEMAKMPDEEVAEDVQGPEAANAPTLIVSGDFQDADDFHKGSGMAGIYTLSNLSQILRFEDFSVTNGPDLRVYLTESASPTKAEVRAGLNLGKLKGNKGSQNYALPVGTDVSKYKGVVIYCQPFSVIFSTASLN